MRRQAARFFGAVEAETLPDAETMLFVRDRQGEVIEGDFVFDHGMSPDQESDRPILKASQDTLALSDRRGTRQKGDRFTAGRQQSGQCLGMLGRQDRRRCHQDSLIAAEAGFQHRQGCYHRLARADIPLDEAIHRLVAPQITANIGQSPLLGSGQPERQGLFDVLDPFFGRCIWQHRQGGLAVLARPAQQEKSGLEQE